MGFLRRLVGGNQPVARQVTVSLLTDARDDAWLEVVGEMHRQDAIGQVAGGRTDRGPAKADGHHAALVPEPDNPHDANAIAVYLEGVLVGYLDRDVAPRWRAVMQAVAATGTVLGCPAVITGGWDRGGGDLGSFGVILNLGSPCEVMIELWSADHAPRMDHRWAGQVVAFTGNGGGRVNGIVIDRFGQLLLAEKAGMTASPRVTKKCQLLVQADVGSASHNTVMAMRCAAPGRRRFDVLARAGGSNDPTKQLQSSKASNGGGRWLATRADRAAQSAPHHRRVDRVHRRRCSS